MQGGNFEENNSWNFRILEKQSKSLTYRERIRIRYHRIMENDFNVTQLKKETLDKPIFIVGFPHSGTSVLTSIFKEHPDLANWTEASEVWESFWEEGLDEDFDKLVPKYEKDVDPIDSLRIKDAFYRFLNSQKKKRFVNKNPRNTVRILYIKKMFPDAKIIHIYRDGREVVNSVTRNLDESMIEIICDRWVRVMNEVKKQKKEISDSDFYEIKYEDFCESPRDIIISAYQKFEIPIIERQIKKIPDKLHNFNGKWSLEINRKHHNILKNKLEPTMKKLGYEW